MLSPVKMLSCLNQEKNMHRSSTVYKWKQSRTVQNKYDSEFWCEFSLEEALLWTGILARSDGLKLKRLNNRYFFKQTCSFSLHKMLIDGLEYLWIIVMFLSVVWTLILTAPIHSRGSIRCNATFLQICFNEETNSPSSWMAWGWIHFQLNKFFCELFL